jgi:hypothetical protein
MEKHSQEPLQPGKIEPHHLHLSDNEQAEGSALDKDAEKRLLRKLDLHIIPILWLIFMLAFLDRTNVYIPSSPSDQHH